MHTYHHNMETYYVLVHISAFTRTPTSVNATLGSSATFSCSSSSGIVAWTVNGATLLELGRADITTSGAGGTSLHIPATEEYNNAIVMCSVLTFDGQVLHGDPVVLKVQGMGKIDHLLWLYFMLHHHY